jgi:7-carboxy-7-deazaguanine synthase
MRPCYESRVSEPRTLPRDDRLAVSEVFDSVQGEGPSAGIPCVFLRLSQCNLRCTWCDTKYTWDWQHHRIQDEVHVESLDAVARRVLAFGPSRLVVTGGEPLIQGAALIRWFALLPTALAVEVETNGTLAPLPELAARVTQWNVSPKLANSGEPLERRLRPAALAALLGTERAWLKLVVATPADAEEAEQLLTATGWPRERVLLMPQGATRRELSERAPFVKAEALRRGLGYSPRLHVEHWDGARGK